MMECESIVKQAREDRADQICRNGMANCIRHLNGTTGLNDRCRDTALQ
jgi:hypothetical protein